MVGRFDASDSTQPFVSRMEAIEMPSDAIRSFLFHLERLTHGEKGLIPSSVVHSVGEIPVFEELEGFRVSGRSALAKVATIKLNGGLGTSMGLEGPKSLLPVRDKLTFLDLIARQALALRKETGSNAPLLLMNSYRTDTESRLLLQSYRELNNQLVNTSFLQHRIPKILCRDLSPVVCPEDTDLEWCPPGHGDLYAALATSGTLSALIESGVEFAFVSNADNLGAHVSSRILGYMIEQGVDFAMEVCERTLADRKGGHLYRHSNGRLGLREIAQCSSDELDGFQDIAKYPLFNTNNVWLRLRAVDHLLRANQGVIPLPTIVNRKPLDPRQTDSPETIQLETAMGAAISLFDRAAAIRVPRQRFSPVKTTNDLLSVRSDAYQLTEDNRLILHPGRTAPPKIQLDPQYFSLIDEFDMRFPFGPPSLRHCDELEVRGNVVFKQGVSVRETAVVTGSDTGSTVSAAFTITGSVILD